MPLPLHAFGARAELMHAAAERMALALSKGIVERGAAAAALSGGSTPAPAYENLAARAMDWPRITFALVDERFIPPDDPGSNEGMLRRTLAPALESGARLLPMYANVANAREAAERANSLYANLDLDIALMGMGADGHTASWFPGSPGLADALDPQLPRDVIAVEAAQAAAAAQRLTLSYAAIARARRVLLLITGEDKRARVEAALAEPLETAPVAALLRLCAAKLDIYWAP